MAIKMTPEELRGIAAKLTNNANEAINLARTIDSNIKTATSNWEGAARNRYEQDFEKVKPVLQKDIPEQLTTLAENLRSMANQFEELDNSFGG